MKKFTVKDFISYNNPCFSCKSNINFYFVTETKDLSSPKQPGYINPIVSAQSTSVDLIKSYSHSLTLEIYHKTNKFYAANRHELESYLTDHSLLMNSACPTCKSTTVSKKLVFDFKNQYVQPTEVRKEYLTIEEKEKVYHLRTNMDKNTTHIEVYSDFSQQSWELDTPALPIYKFKNRANIIKKIKTYIIFS